MRRLEFGAPHAHLNIDRSSEHGTSNTQFADLCTLSSCRVSDVPMRSLVWTGRRIRRHHAWLRRRLLEGGLTPGGPLPWILLGHELPTFSELLVILGQFHIPKSALKVEPQLSSTKAVMEKKRALYNKPPALQGGSYHGSGG
jgi:hypothetical protein